MKTSTNAAEPNIPIIIPPLPPEITGFMPPAALVGQPVTIDGRRLGQVTAVMFNGVSAKFTKPTQAQQIQTVVPAGASTGPVTVQSPIGNATSFTNFNVVVPPVLTGATPPAAAPGAKIDLNGDHLAEVSGVTFNGTAATFKTNGPHDVKVTVPNVAPGAVTITVTNLAGSSSTPFTVT